MINFFRSFKKRQPNASAERREHPRYTSFIKGHYMVRDHWYKGSIRNISQAGAYILLHRQKKFSPGEDILLVVDLRVVLDQIKGKIIWNRSHGFGVAFDTSEPDFSKLNALLAARCLF